MAVWHFMLIIGNWHLSLDCVWFLSIKINCYFTGKSAWTTYAFIWFLISSLVNSLCQYSEPVYFLIFFPYLSFISSVVVSTSFGNSGSFFLWISFPLLIFLFFPSFFFPFFFLYFFFFSFIFLRLTKANIWGESNNFAASEGKKPNPSWVTKSWVLADKIRCQKCYKTNQMSNGWTVAALRAWRRCGERRLRTPIPAFVRSGHFSVTSSAGSALIGAAFDSRQLS